VYDAATAEVKGISVKWKQANGLTKPPRLRIEADAVLIEGHDR